MSEIKMFSLDVCIKLPAELKKGLDEVIEATGKTQEELITHYVEDGIAKAKPKVSRQLFLNRTRDILRKHNVPDEVVDEIGEKFSY